MDTATPELAYEGYVKYADDSVISLQCFEGDCHKCPDQGVDGVGSDGVLDGYVCEHDCAHGPADKRQVPYVESLPGLGDRDTEVVWQLHRGKLDEIAGRQVTDEEAERIAEALEFSSIPEALDNVVESVCGFPPDEDEDEDPECE